MQPMPASTPVSPPSGNPAMVGGIVALVCALFLLIGTFGRGWFTMGEGRMTGGIGLVGYSVCAGERCEGKFVEIDLLDKGDKDIAAARVLTLLGGLASVVLVGLTGALALSRKARKAPLMALYIVVGITAFFALFFVGRTLSEIKGDRGPGLGWAFFLAFVGYVGAILSSALMIRPAGKREAGDAPGPYGMHPGAYGMQPGGYAPPYGQPMPMPMQQPLAGQPGQPAQAQPGPSAQAQPGQPQGAPACPRCQAGGQVQYAAQYSRWFCGRCQQYV